MRRVLAAFILVAAAIVPAQAVADKPEELCVGFELMIYGDPVQLIPEQCIPCSWGWCGAMLNRCPRLICGSAAKAEGAQSTPFTPLVHSKA